MTRPRVRAALLLLLLAVAAGCSRAVDIGSGSPTAYSINVTNGGAIDLAVSWEDGSSKRTLGLVRAGRTERFIIASPRRTDVTITGATPDGSRVISSVPIVLVPGTPVDVTLR